VEKLQRAGYRHIDVANGPFPAQSGRARLAADAAVADSRSGPDTPFPNLNVPFGNEASGQGTHGSGAIVSHRKLDDDINQYPEYHPGQDMDPGGHSEASNGPRQNEVPYNPCDNDGEDSPEQKVNMRSMHQ
jgi:hypothetical protein